MLNEYVFQFYYHIEFSTIRLILIADQQDLMELEQYQYPPQLEFCQVHQANKSKHLSSLLFYTPLNFEEQV